MIESCNNLPVVEIPQGLCEEYKELRNNRVYGPKLRARILQRLEPLLERYPNAIIGGSLINKGYIDASTEVEEPDFWEAKRRCTTGGGRYPNKFKLSDIDFKVRGDEAKSFIDQGTLYDCCRFARDEEVGLKEFVEKLQV